MSEKTILLAHGNGGLLTNQLIAETFLPRLRNDVLAQLGDGAVVQADATRLCMTTDGYVVSPWQFPGGNIGSLAVHGTINDLAMCGATPLCLSAAFIIEEGFARRDLETIVDSMAAAARQAGVDIVTGDTKVVQHGAADGIFITTTGIGCISYPAPLGTDAIQPGDVLIVNGSLGDHGAALLAARQELGITTDIRSDSAALHQLVAGVLAACGEIHCMRDATRGGLGTVLVELAHQSGRGFSIDEAAVPVSDPVRGVCEILGYDPLYLANEGKLVMSCSADAADRVLSVMRDHPLGRRATVIGHVDDARPGRVVMRTAIGGSREIDLPSGELVPRIC